MPDDTTTFEKAKGLYARNSGKTNATVGGLSLVTLMAIFATKGELNGIRDRQAETWRAVQDINVCLMQRAETERTNKFEVTKTTP